VLGLAAAGADEDAIAAADVDEDAAFGRELVRVARLELIHFAGGHEHSGESTLPARVIIVRGAGSRDTTLRAATVVCPEQRSEPLGASRAASVNISTDHLLNIHRVARLRPNARWTNVRAVTLDTGVGAEQILKMYNRNY
jgi:hypothetical protein